MSENNWLTKKLAYLGIFYSAMISIGASFLSAGIGILFGILPLINEFKKTGATDEDYNLIKGLNSSAEFFIYGGLTVIMLSIAGAYVIIYRSKSKNHNKQLTLISYTKEPDRKYYPKITSLPERYYETKKRLAYHPPDKQFTAQAETATQSPVPVPETPKPRGTMPVGFTHKMK